MVSMPYIRSYVFDTFPIKPHTVQWKLNRITLHQIRVPYAHNVM